ncbi:hypothetical protein FBQ81_04100 [Chloroflexi bacterium CFX6]|nr:hypothetical protein [Chloroflexi bacterium CFX6]
MNAQDRELLRKLDALEVEISKMSGPSQLPVEDLRRGIGDLLKQCFEQNGFPRVKPENFTPELRAEWLREIEGGIKTAH